MRPKDADGLVNCADSDQTAPVPDLGLHCSLMPICPCNTGVRETDQLPHDKTNKMTVRPAKTQISLGICS